MKRNIFNLICGLGILSSLCACKNGDIDFPDYEKGTTAYFAYQYPIRTIVLGDDEPDLTLDHAHKCQIQATFGGSYNGSNGVVEVAVDESLCNNLFFEDGSPVKAMPSSYYQLSTTSLAYMYIYELLNLIGASDPAQALERMKEFETGYLDSGIGDRSMRENLHRWMMEFAVLSGASLQEVIPFLDSSLLERDRNLLMLRNPLEHTDEEVFGALNALTEGKTERSSALIKEPERARHLFAEVWREMSEHYEDDGWDLFTCCFGKLRKFPWHPLANAIYLDQKDREDTEYKVTECRMFVCKKNEWSEIRYDELFFDKYRIHAVMHEADRLIRRYLGTGHYLRQKQGEEWITPYVEAVIEADKAAALEAAKPKVRIDLSGLDKIRRDAQITRDSLLTQEEIREQAPIPGELPAVNDRPAAVRIEQPQEIVPEISQEKEKSAIIKIPSLDETLVRVLESAMRGEPAAELIRENHLMPSVVTDAINEALFDEIGDNVLECEGDEITLVDDYREDLERLLEGEN